ncbi:CRTAC1 family protein [Dokdonella sp.]|uniref:CRTAC1 family protein n=1 Tax=Dokdonella sp. TaxID=2291710 RepID=UPI00352785F1
MRKGWSDVALVILSGLTAFSPVLGQVTTFTDQTAAAGIGNTSTSIGLVSPILGGGVVADFNRDGWQDIFYPTGGNGADRLFINNGNGTFTNQAASWGINQVHLSSAAAVGDYNGDDLPDIFVTCFGPTSTPQMGHHHLYRNTGSAFVDEAVAAGVNRCSTISPDGWGGSWGDIDLDGDLDLAISGFLDPATGNCLMRNNGNGTFTDITTSSGLRPSIQGLSGYTPHFVDMNDDRYPELIWIGDFSTSLYYINNGDGTFTNGTAASGTSQDFSEMGMTVGDWNEDGLFDFYVSTIGTNNFYVNQGNHVYQNQADLVGVTNGGFGWATVTFDIDHDSHMDLINVAQVGRNSVFRNRLDNGVLAFDEIAVPIGLGFNGDGRGLARFDYDNDGDQDLIFFPGGLPIILMRNDLGGPDRNWLRIFLENDGVRGATPHGMGAKVSIQIAGRTLISRIEGGSNYLSQNEASAHFGLGAATSVDLLRVEWPNGMVTEAADVAANQTLTLHPPDLIFQAGFQ